MAFYIAKVFCILFIDMISQELMKKNKKRLLQEKQHLENLLSRVAKRDAKHGEFHAEYPEFGDKEDENAAEVAAYGTNIAEEYDLEKTLHKVEAALKRIKEKTYGICANGGEELPVSRLEAVPEAENCVKHERK